MTSPIWIRYPRTERYRISNQQQHAAAAWQRLTGNTSATYGDLCALAMLGAEVRVLVDDKSGPMGKRVMLLNWEGVMSPQE